MDYLVKDGFIQPDGGTPVLTAGATVGYSFVSKGSAHSFHKVGVPYTSTGYDYTALHRAI